MMRRRLFADYDKLMMEVCLSDPVLEKFPTFPENFLPSLSSRLKTTLYCIFDQYGGLGYLPSAHEVVSFYSSHQVN